MAQEMVSWKKDKMPSMFSPLFQFLPFESRFLFDKRGVN